MAIYTLMKYYGSKRRMVPVINSCLPNDYKVWIEGQVLLTGTAPLQAKSISSMKRN